MSAPAGHAEPRGDGEDLLRDDREEGTYQRRKVRVANGVFSGEESMKSREEQWMKTDEKEQAPKSYRESLLQNENSRVCWWEWERGEEEDDTGDYGIDTDFSKVLNPSDGISVDYTNPLCPVFSFEEKEKERLMKPFRRTLIVKLLGRLPAFGFMVKKLRQIWERKGKIDVFDLANYFYLINFQNKEDYMEALTGGPWVISDAYLSVARWRPEFSPKNAKIESVIAWVRLPDLPAPLFDKKFLLNLGNSIGKAIRLDIHTAQRARGKFARMCVELDLTKPLVPEFNVEGRNGSGGSDRSSGEGEEQGEEREVWKTVQRPRRIRRNDMVPQQMQSGSRYAVLDVETGEEGASKENVRAQEKGKMGEDQLKNNRFQQRRQGGKDGMGEVLRGPGSLKNKSVGRAEQGSMKDKDGRGKSGILANKNVNAEKLRDYQAKTTPDEGVAASYREKHGGKIVNMAGKENLNPGDPLANVPREEDMYVGGLPDRGPVENPGEGLGMNMEEEGLKSVLVD
ncbi:hypothetical protein K1719_000127 [Acacia pycnantha]|nr:hypothetical protein K1719_000127 [Acacia pycnantha]